MKITYNIFIYIYILILKFISLFNKKAYYLLEGQKNLLEKVKESISNSEKIVWFHASSLGEYEQVKPIIISYLKKNLDHKILLTFYSPSGYRNFNSEKFIDWVFYLPHDRLTDVRNFINIVNPIKVIFVKNEFWYNYIMELSKKKIPIYFVCSIFRKDQYFFKFYGFWFRKQLRKVTCFFLQDMNSRNLLEKIDIKNISVVGDSRFDIAIKNTKEEFSNDKISEFCKNSKIFIAASINKKDMRIIKDIPKKMGYKIIIVPHETVNSKKYILAENYITLSNYTNYDKDYDYLIIDEIGILKKLYRYANLVYLGGGFSKGIHNITEAIAYKKHVIFGPKYKKFPEAIDIIKLNYGDSISNSNDLKNSIIKFENSNLHHTIEEYLNKKTGVANKIATRISTK